MADTERAAQAEREPMQGLANYLRAIASTMQIEDGEALYRWADEVVASRAQEAPAQGWMPIETAPKYTEVLCWREDQGVFISQLTTPGEVMSTEELERCEFPDDFEEWFNAAWGWQEGDLRPTHWMPLPAAPEQQEKPT